MTDLIRRAAPDAIGKADGRTLDLRLYSWGDIAEDTNEGIREQLMPGVFGDVDPSRVTLMSQRHDGPLVGVGQTITETDDGIMASFRVAETPAGDELLALATSEPPVLRDASVEFKPIDHQEVDGVVQRTAADLRRVAIVERGAYRSAVITAIRSEPDMSEQTTEQEHQEEAPVVTRSEADPGRLDNLEERVTRLAATLAHPAGAAEPEGLAKFDSLADYTAAVYRGEAAADLVQRAAAEQTTANNAGVTPPAWLSDVKRIVDLGRRAISAFGGAKPLPGTGMELDWPYLNSSNTLVGAQASEFDESTSARVDIAKASESILTYSGYSDLSYQLLQRSSPSYREAYQRILLAAWGSVTDAAFVTALEADATGAQVMGAMLGSNVTLATSADADDIIDATGHGLSNGDPIVFTALTGGSGVTAGRIYWVIADSLTADDFKFSATPGGSAVDLGSDITAGTVAKVTDTGAAFRAALAQASVSVEDATGSPASIVLASTDVFLALAAMSGIQDPAGGLNAAQGQLQASTLLLRSSGLAIHRSPNVTAGKVIVSNGMAAAWHEDGPKWATAEDVAQLGQYVGVYSFNAAATYIPAGVVEATLI